MIDCRKLEFSPALAQQRMDKAARILGSGVLRRLLCLVLYLLGVSRRSIADSLDIPPDSAKSIIKAVERDGLPALEDRRRTTSAFLPSREPEPVQIQICKNDQWLSVQLGHPDRSLQVPLENNVQVKVVLLSLLNSALVPPAEVAALLGYSRVHTHNLAEKLQHEDVSALLDKRKGQTKDYRVSVDVKAELIQQFVMDVVSQGKTSGKKLSKGLEERCRLSVPERTIAHHLDQMGLSRIKQSLPDLLSTLKKTPVAAEKHES